MHAMQLKLRGYVRITISFISQKLRQILIFWTFSAKCSIFAYILQKIGHFELGNEIMMLLWRHIRDAGTYFDKYG